MKIVKSLSMIAAVVAIAGGATYAAVFFKDSKTVNNNTFAAGTVKISLSNPNGSLPFQVTNWAPGDVEELTLYIKNEGTLDVKVPKDGSKVEGYWDMAGYPDKYVELVGFKYWDGTEWTETAIKEFTIAAGQTLHVKAFVKFNNDADDALLPINNLQGKTYRANFTIVAEQADNNPVE